MSSSGFAGSSGCPNAVKTPKAARLSDQYRLFTARRCAAASSFFCPPCAVILFLGAFTAARSSQYLDALCSLILGALHLLGPPLVAKYIPMHLGRTWLLIHSLRSLLHLAFAAELVPCHSECRVLRDGGGPLFIIFVETVFGLFQQADLAQALLARAVVAVSYSALFQHVGIRLPYLQAALMLCVTATTATLHDLRRRRAFRVGLLLPSRPGLSQALPPSQSSEPGAPTSDSNPMPQAAALMARSSGAQGTAGDPVSASDVGCRRRTVKPGEPAHSGHPIGSGIHVSSLPSEEGIGRSSGMASSGWSQPCLQTNASAKDHDAQAPQRTGGTECWAPLVPAAHCEHLALPADARSITEEQSAATLLSLQQQQQESQGQMTSEVEAAVLCGQGQSREQQPQHGQEQQQQEQQHQSQQSLDALSRQVLALNQSLAQRFRAFSALPPPNPCICNFEASSATAGEEGAEQEEGRLQVGPAAAVAVGGEHSPEWFADSGAASVCWGRGGPRLDDDFRGLEDFTVSEEEEDMEKDGVGTGHWGVADQGIGASSQRLGKGGSGGMVAAASTAAADAVEAVLRTAQVVTAPRPRFEEAAQERAAEILQKQLQAAAAVHASLMHVMCEHGI